jgi:tetratricopeptide (TPR) repeat protein
LLQEIIFVPEKKSSDKYTGESPHAGYAGALPRRPLSSAMDDAIPWTGKANAYFERDRYENAIGSFEKALSLDPRNAHALNG